MTRRYARFVLKKEFPLHGLYTSGFPFRLQGKIENRIEGRLEGSLLSVPNDVLVTVYSSVWQARSLGVDIRLAQNINPHDVRNLGMHLPAPIFAGAVSLPNVQPFPHMVQTVFEHLAGTFREMRPGTLIADSSTFKGPDIKNRLDPEAIVQAEHSIHLLRATFHHVLKNFLGTEFKL